MKFNKITITFFGVLILATGFSFASLEAVKYPHFVTFDQSNVTKARAYLQASYPHMDVKKMNDDDVISFANDETKRVEASL